MKTKVLDYIDFEKVNALLEGFNKSSGFVTAILDLEGNVLSKSGWRQLCTEFHRINPETAKNCKKSDTILANKMRNGEKYHFYKCLNGLVDVAVPLIINGEHIANLFSGQFFFHEPDPIKFKEQARKYGFTEHEYLKALGDIPVVSEERVKIAMDFLLNMTQLISDVTLQRLEQSNLNDALTKSEERSRSVLDNMLEGCQIIGFDWRYIYLNSSAEVHNKRKNKELLGKCFQDMWPGIEETLVFKIIKQTLDTRISTHFENEFIFPDASIGWFDLSIQPVPEGVFILSIDITERKIAENAQRQSKFSEEKFIDEIKRLNERIITATRASRVGIWDWDIVNNLLTWDDQMYALYGLKKEEFAGAFEAWVNGLHPDDREFCQNETRLALLGRKEYDTEFRVVWPDGTVHFCKAKGDVFLNDMGEPIRMVGINYDITEQKKIDEKIREKDQEFRKLSANVPDLIFQFTRKPDGSFCVPIASEGIRNIFGCTPEEVVDDFTPISRVIYPDDAKRVIREIEYSAKHLTYFTCEFRVQIPGREIQWIYSKSSPERLPDGSITWYGFNTDITKRKQVEETLKYNSALLRKLNDELEFRVSERTSQLEAANKELESFSYSVSHDLRSPLRHINGFAEILTKKYSDQLPEDARKHMNTIIDSAKKMGALIDDLLNFSRTGRAELRKSRLKMNQIIDDALVQVKTSLTDRNIELKISPLPVIYGDYNLLRLVWINLLDNAVKYTRTRKQAQIRIGHIEEKRESVFFIQDNGVGFDMKYVHKLFGVFQRLHSSTQFDGTGIGLANVQRIILRHGGRTWAEAEPDNGATFYFSIPKEMEEIL